MNIGDLVKVVVRIPGDAVMVNEEIGIIIDVIKMEQFGPKQVLVMWPNDKCTISSLFHLKVIKSDT